MFKIPLSWKGQYMWEKLVKAVLYYYLLAFAAFL